MQLIPVPRFIDIIDSILEFNDSIIIESFLPDEFSYLCEILREELERKPSLHNLQFSYNKCDGVNDDIIPESLKAKIPKNQEALFANEGYYLETNA